MTDSPNVDAAEIAHFDRIAQLWWDPHGKMGQLHAINGLRLRFITDRLIGTAPRVVDVGCGGGILAEALAKHGARVTGIDLSTLSLKVARQHAERGALAIDYREIDVETLAREEAGTFDAVTCMEMLEHVPDPGSVVRACAVLLKPGGRLLLSTLNRTPAAFALAIVGAEYIARLLPTGTHQYRDFIKPSELARLLRDAGLVLEDVSGLLYEPWRNAARIVRRIDVNYLACARKPE